MKGADDDEPSGLAIAEHVAGAGFGVVAFFVAGYGAGRTGCLDHSVVPPRAPTRYLLAMVALLLMVASPLITFFFYWQPSSSLAIGSVSLMGTKPEMAGHMPGARASIISYPVVSSVNVFVWMVEAWFVGVAVSGLRTLSGLFLLERLRWKQAVPVTAKLRETCRALEQRLGLNRMIRYCECKCLQTPAVVGWFQPMVLLPVTALTGLSKEQLEAVIAHELAHIKRFDAFVNIFEIASEIVFFYHPAVWWLNKRIRVERENCCDDIAISVCGHALEYAQALVLMEGWRSAPALAMAATRGPVARRIARLLEVGAETRSMGLLAGFLCLALALGAGDAFLSFAHARPGLPLAASAQSAPPSPLTQPSRQSPSPSASTTTAEPLAARAQAGDHQTGESAATSYIEAMKSAGLSELTVDELIALRVQGVTPEYVRGIHEQGLHPSADSIVAMRVQNVTPEYIHDLQKMGLTPGEDQIVALKVQGVTADYIQGLKASGIQTDVDRIIGLKVQDVTPEYVHQLRAAKLSLNADQVIALKVQGVTPEYVRGLLEQGINADADQLVAMRVQNVTPEYVRDLGATGLHPMADQIIALRVQGITPEYIRALQSAGLKLDPDSVITAKLQGITPEFILKARKHGFQKLDLDQLIELKRLGILDAPAEI